MAQTSLYWPFSHSSFMQPGTFDRYMSSCRISGGHVEHCMSSSDPVLSARHLLHSRG